MSFIESFKEQWNALPGWGKWTAAGIVVLVVILGMRSYSSGKNQQSSSTVPIDKVKNPLPAVKFGPETIDNNPAATLPTSTSSLPTPSPKSYGQAPGQIAPEPYLGLLGPNVAIDFAKRTYKNQQGLDAPLPISSSAKLVQGGQNRVHYQENGKQYLLTSGIGPGVLNSGQPIDSPQITPKAYGGGAVNWSLSHWIVSLGDNMQSVAAQLGVRGGWVEMARANGIDPFGYVTVGQKLRIPR